MIKEIVLDKPTTNVKDLSAKDEKRHCPGPWRNCWRNCWRNMCPHK